MLLMGWFIFKWTFYFYAANAEVQYWCEKEGGLKVYVTPEDYRKEVGEEEWQKLYFLNDNIPDEFDNKDNWITFNGKQYQPSTRETYRAWWFWVVKDENYKEKWGVWELDKIFYDVVSKKVLLSKQEFSVYGMSELVDWSGLGLLLGESKSCLLPEELRFFSSNYINYDIKEPNNE